MTDRHAGYIVTLASDTREDDAEATIAALSMIKGVISVRPIVANLDQQVAMVRVDAQWRERLWALMREDTDA